MMSLILSLALLSPAHAGERVPDFEPSPEALQRLKEKTLKTVTTPLRKAGAAFTLMAPIQPTEEIKALVDYPDHAIETVPAMELNKSQMLYYSPWAGHSWSLRYGQVARRFADGNFPNSDDWKANYDYTHVFSPPNALAQMGQVNALSPAEKYDLLINPNHEFKLTEANWEEGGKYFRDKGVVESWMGICHGTTAAGVMERRPTGAVDAIAADGHTRIRFYPSDIKGLASEFWAYVNYNARFAGIRCNIKKEDMPNRRMFPECFDTNAGAFHLALVNQLGLFKRALIMDRSPDIEVWNHTIIGYRFDWVNPKSKDKSQTFGEALVRRDDWQNDPFQSYRSPSAKYVIGVKALVTYRTSIPATTRDRAPTSEPSSTKEYKYDLELDENLRVVGGEWYQSDYPDFVWHPSLLEPAQAKAEAGLPGTWDVNAPLPPEWQQAAINATAEKIPLAHILEALIAKSRENGGT